MYKAAAFKLRFNSRGVPLHRQALKWLMMNSRANKLQLRHTLRQEKEMADMAVKDFVRQQKLPEEFSRRFFISPTTARNMMNTRYDFETKNILNSPLLGLAVSTPTVKPTDTLLHEVGHAKTDLNGTVSMDEVKKRLTPPLFTAFKRLLHPETSDLVRIEDMADRMAFGNGGNISLHKQMRHHPAIAGYRAVGRMQAGAQLAAAGLGLGALGYQGKKLYDRSNEHKEQV